MAGERFYNREFKIRLSEIVVEGARIARFSDMPKKARWHERQLHEDKEMLRIVLQDAVETIGSAASREALRFAVADLVDAQILTTTESLRLVESACAEALKRVGLQAQA